jgi:hypothetical protein
MKLGQLVYHSFLSFCSKLSQFQLEVLLSHYLPLTLSSSLDILISSGSLCGLHHPICALSCSRWLRVIALLLLFAFLCAAPSINFDQLRIFVWSTSSNLCTKLFQVVASNCSSFVICISLCCSFDYTCVCPCLFKLVECRSESASIICIRSLGSSAVHNRYQIIVWLMHYFTPSQSWWGLTLFHRDYVCGLFRCLIHKICHIRQHHIVTSHASSSISIVGTNNPAR